MGYRRKPTFSLATEEISEEEFDKHIVKFMGSNNRWECLFWGLIHLGKSIEEGDICTKHPISVQAISASIWHIIKNGDLQNIQMAKVEYCEQAATELCKKSEGMISTENGKVLSILLSVFCPNYAYQGDMLYLVANTLILLGLAPFRGIASDIQYAEDFFNKSFGVGCTDYYRFVFCLWSMSLSQLYLDRSSWISKSKKKDELAAMFAKIFDSISISAKASDLEKAEFTKQFNGKAKIEAIFNRYPLINIDDNFFTFAGHPYLKVMLTRKFLQRAIAISRDKGKEGESFRQSVANRFESLVGELIRGSLADIKLQREIEFEKNTNRKSVDWILIEKENGKNVRDISKCCGREIMKQHVRDAEHEVS